MLRTYMRNLLTRVIDTLKYRGLIRSVQGILSIIEDYYFDLRNGTETMRWVELDDLDIKSENKKRGIRYEPTRVRHFRKLLSILTFPNDSVYVDLGSGKGRLLLLAPRYGFTRVVGVEFSHELCEIARKNLLIFRKKRAFDVEIEIIESDVVNYEIKNDENVFFFFNPFDEVIMNKVIKNIYTSLEKNQRSILLIYSHPVYLNALDTAFTKLTDYVYGSKEFAIYSNDQNNNVRIQGISYHEPKQ
jgi:SAM-dependent methyltransferase